MKFLFALLATATLATAAPSPTLSKLKTAATAQRAELLAAKAELITTNGQLVTALDESAKLEGEVKALGDERDVLAKQVEVLGKQVISLRAEKLEIGRERDLLIFIAAILASVIVYSLVLGPLVNLLTRFIPLSYGWIIGPLAKVVLILGLPVFFFSVGRVAVKAAVKMIT